MCLWPVWTPWSEAIAGHQFTEIHWIIKALCSHCLVRGTPVGRTPGRPAIPHPCWHASLKQAPKLISNAMDLKKVQHLNRLNVWGSVCCRESPTFYVMIICLIKQDKLLYIAFRIPKYHFLFISYVYILTVRWYTITFPYPAALQKETASLMCFFFTGKLFLRRPNWADRISPELQQWGLKIMRRSGYLTVKISSGFQLPN